MDNFKWFDANATRTGKFQIYKNGAWYDLSAGYGLDANVDTRFAVESDFDGSSNPYVTFVTIASESATNCVMLETPGTQVSVPINTGTSPIGFQAGIVMSALPKVFITWAPFGSITCYMFWNGSSWQLGGAPVTDGIFNVAASKVTIVVSSSQSNT